MHGYDPKSLFNNNNFVNRNDLLHNNMDNILLNEEIKEYSILIDSKDRNYQVYPNPYNYTVIFNPLPKTREYNEDPAPVINNKIENVRYIKLERVIMPLFNKIKYNPGKDPETFSDIAIPVIETRKPTTDDLYTVLCLGNEYNDENSFSTNDVFTESFAVIYFDKKINNTHYIGTCNNGVKYFPQDNLGKISKLKISFVDSHGNPIKCNHVNKNIMSNFECTCKDPEGDLYTDCYRHNLHHPLNPIFQHHIHLKIGVVEPRLKKKLFN